MTTCSLFKADWVPLGDVTTATLASHLLVLGLSHSELTQDRVNSALLFLDALPGYAQPLYPFPAYWSFFSPWLKWKCFLLEKNCGGPGFISLMALIITSFKTSKKNVLPKPATCFTLFIYLEVPLSLIFTYFIPSATGSSFHLGSLTCHLWGWGTRGL